MNKLKLIFCICLMLSLFSCKSEIQEDAFVECFDEKEQIHWNKLRTSFGTFLDNNFNGSQEKVLEVFPELFGQIKSLIFERSDSLLFDELEKDSFLYIGCFFVSNPAEKIKYKEDYFDCYFNTNLKYYNCIISKAKEDALTNNYLEMVKLIGAPTPATLQANLKSSIDDNLVNESMINNILIFEFYYWLLKERFKKNH